MENKLKKDQLIIVLVLVSIAVGTVIYLYVVFKGGTVQEDEVTLKEDIYKVDSEDINKQRRDYENMLEASKDKENVEKEVDLQNRVEVDLSFFSKDEKNITPVDEETQGFIESTKQDDKDASTDKTIERSVSTGNLTVKEKQNTVSRYNVSKEIKEEEIIKEGPRRRRRIKETSSNAITKEKNIQVRIPVFVYGDHQVKTGTIVKFKTSKEVRVQDRIIPSNTFIYGRVGSLSNERVNVAIDNIKVGNETITLSMTTFDMDGMEGLYAPVRVEQEIRKDIENSAIDAGRSATVSLPVIGSITIRSTKKKVNNPVINIPNKYKLTLQSKIN